MRTQAPALAPFFRSDLQARLLAVLLLGPEPELSAAELQTRLEASRAGVHQELRRLMDSGVIERRMVGRSALYRRAVDSPLLEPLTALVERTLGLETELRRRLDGLDGVQAAAIYGSWAAGAIGPRSDIDVLVIGEPDADELERAARAVERLAGRDVNVTLYDPADWATRVDSGAGFATTVLDRPLISLVGTIPGTTR